MKRTSQGFTLLEMMVVTAIASIVTFGAFMLLKTGNEQLAIIHAKMSLEETTRESLFKMAQEIRQTAYHKIVNFGAGNSLGGDTINFRVPVPDPDESTLVDQNYSPLWAFDINYALDPDTHQIMRTAIDSATGETKQAILANNITSLSFSRPSATSGLVTITVAAQQEFSNGRRIPEEPLQISVQAETRNP